MLTFSPFPWLPDYRPLGRQPSVTARIGDAHWQVYLFAKVPDSVEAAQQVQLLLCMAATLLAFFSSNTSVSICCASLPNKSHKVMLGSDIVLFYLFALFSATGNCQLESFTKGMEDADLIFVEWWLADEVRLQEMSFSGFQWHDELRETAHLINLYMTFLLWFGIIVIVVRYITTVVIEQKFCPLQGLVSNNKQ